MPIFWEKTKKDAFGADISPKSVLSIFPDILTLKNQFPSCLPTEWELIRTIIETNCFQSYFIASSMATAQATVIPTMGLLPAPIRPIIST